MPRKLATRATTGRANLARALVASGEQPVPRAAAGNLAEVLEAGVSLCPQRSPRDSRTLQEVSRHDYLLAIVGRRRL